MLDAQHVISSQLLIAHEQRMFQRVYALNAALARHIDARWTSQINSQEHMMIYLALDNWRLDLEQLLFRFHDDIMRDGMMHVIRLVGQKNEQLEFLLNFIRPELRRYSQQQAELIESFLRARKTAMCTSTAAMIITRECSAT